MDIQVFQDSCIIDICAMTPLCAMSIYLKWGSCKIDIVRSKISSAFRILIDGAPYTAQGYSEVRLFFAPESDNLGSVGQPFCRACQGLGTIYSPALLD